MLVPFLLALVVVGVTQLERYREFREASAVSEATAQAADVIALESQVRHEWLSALDVATIGTTDFLDYSPEIAGRASELGSETERLFVESSQQTDQRVGDLGSVEISQDGIDRLGRLASVRERVLAEDITSAELDLFYSRLVLDLTAAIPNEATPSSGSLAQFDVLRQQALNQAIVDTGGLQQLLTGAVEDLVAVRSAEWTELRDAAFEAHASVVASSRTGTEETASLNTRLLDVVVAVETLAVQQSQAPSTDADVLAQVLDLRSSLIEEAPVLVDDLEATTNAIAQNRSQARADALISLITSGLLVLLSVLLLAAAIRYLARSIASPLRRAADTAARVGQGDLDVELELGEGPQEVRLMSSALSQLVGTVSLIERQAVAMSEGDLESPVLDEQLPGQLGRSLESSIGRWRDTSQQVQVSNMITAAVNEATSDAQLLCDDELLVMEANPAAELLFDMTAEQLVGQKLSGIAHLAVLESIDELGDSGTVTDEAVISGRAGEIRTLATITRVTTATGRRHSVLLRDVSDRQQILDRLSFEVQHDRLTGLRSRQPFVDTLHRSLKRESTGVLIVDIDGFGEVNARFNEWAGDQVLHVLADRLSNGIDGIQQLARFGGDEFALSTSTSDPGHLAALAERIHQLVAPPVRVADQQIALTLSIGAAVAKGEATDSVIGNAMIATRYAKRSGGNCTVVFDDALEAEVQNRRRVESNLREAIESNRLELHLQPVVDMASQAIIGAEALVRWPREDGSIIPPSDFIPIAEESTLIVDLDRWVIERTCELLHEWSAGPFGEIHISVNVSARHFSDGDLVTAVKDSTRRWRVDPDRLGIEVTESVLVEDRLNCSRVLNELSEFGVPLLIDDFGTGYSNLAYLQDFPFDILKIDQSFVARADVDFKSKSLVSALVGLGRALGLLVHAEGVETEAQRTLLAELGCDFAQGYLFSAPVPIAEFITSGTGLNEPMEPELPETGSEEFPLAS